MNQQTPKFIDFGNKRSSEALSNTMVTAKEIATLIEYSPKCESIFWEVKDIAESEDLEDLNNNKKRWIIDSMPRKMDSKRFLLRIYY